MAGNAILLGSILLLVISAIISPLPDLKREFWHDSLLHNGASYEPKNYAEFKRTVASQSQPLMEYAMRRYITFPLLGMSELSMRIPDMLFWIGSILIVTIMTGVILKRENFSGNLNAQIGILIALLWLTSIDMLPFYATEGRHYSWCLFVSLLWGYSLLLKDNMPKNIFDVVSFVYLNSHFFVWPLVIGIYLLNIAKNLKGGNRGVAARNLGGLMAILIISTGVNWDSLIYFLTTPPRLEGEITPHAALLAEGEKGVEAIIRYVLIYNIYLTLPLSLIVCWYKKLYLLAGSILLTIATITVISIAGNYHMNSRYFIPFSATALLTIMCLLPSALKMLNNKKENKAALALTICILSIISIVKFAVELSRVDSTTLSLKEKNFTNMHKLFAELDEKKTPVAIISLAEWEAVTLRFYSENLREGSHKIEIIEADKKPRNLHSTWLPLKRKNPSLETLIYTAGDREVTGKELDKFEIIYKTRDYIKREIYRAPNDIELFELGDILEELNNPNKLILTPR